MFTDDQIQAAAEDTLAVQEKAWDLPMTDALWIRMHVDNLRKGCGCGEC